MAIPFEHEGFLSEEADEIKELIVGRYPRTFAICRDVNRLAHRFRKSIALDYENQLHIVLVCLLQRIMDSFQSVVVLMELGLEGDCNTITRSSVEAMLQARKLSTDTEYLHKYLGSDQLRRRKILNAAKSNPKGILGSILHGAQLDATLSEVVRDIEEMSLSETSVQSIARDVGLDTWYDLTYRVLSEEVHAGPRSLEKYLDRDAEKDDLVFNFNPKTERLVAVLISHAAITLIGMDSLEKIFHTGHESAIDQLFASISEFAEE